jgi:hypothetical protein
MDLVGIDIGIINLSICGARYEEEKSDGGLPKLDVKFWEIVNLGTQKLQESIPKLVEQLHLLELVFRVDKVIIERQVGRSNPKMLAMAHAVQTVLVEMQHRTEFPREIIFENSSVKFSRAKKAGFEFICDTKNPKYNTPGKKRTATKNNAIQLAEETLKANDQASWLATFSVGVKKIRENLADSLGLIVGYLLRA